MPISQEKSKQEPSKGCVIEMDTVVLGGIPRLYGIVRGELARQQVALDEGHFTRFLLGAYLETGLNRALQGTGRRATPDMMQTIRSAYLSQLADAPLPAGHPVIDLVKGLSETPVRVGLLTRLGQEEAARLFAPLLALPHVSLLCETQAMVGAFPWDVWRRAALSLQMSDRLCVALVAASASCKAALAASLPVVVIPDAMTDYQDFTGAHHVLDKLDAGVLPAVRQVLRV